MFKTLKRLTFHFFAIAFFQSHAYALDCVVATSLHNLQCSPGLYFSANSQAMLNDYLANPKLAADGKLLNLLINFNVTASDVSIATPCGVKLNAGVGIRPVTKGICIKASNIIFSGSNSLIVSDLSPITLNAGDTINILRSTIESRGDVSINTTKFQPYDGKIFVSVDSKIAARKIFINSRSSLYLQPALSLVGTQIVLNGANCEVIATNASATDMRERISQKFLSNSKFRGNCGINSIPSNLKISFQASPINPRLIKFKIPSLAAKNAEVVWVIDHAPASVDRVTHEKLMTAGSHYVEAYIIDKRGNYRHLSSFLAVSTL